MGIFCNLGGQLETPGLVFQRATFKYIEMQYENVKSISASWDNVVDKNILDKTAYFHNPF